MNRTLRLLTPLLLALCTLRAPAHGEAASAFRPAGREAHGTESLRAETRTETESPRTVELRTAPEAPGIAEMRTMTEEPRTAEARTETKTPGTAQARPEAAAPRRTKAATQRADAAHDGSESPALRFRPDGRFRILQLTDLHYTASARRSGHVLPMVADLIDRERPDLIVLTGDLVYDRPAAPLLRRIGTLLAGKGVPYAVTLGNHDAEQDLTRGEVYAAVRALPGCINARFNPPGEPQGTFAVPIDTDDGRCAAVLYVMDSNDYNADDGTYAGVDAGQVAWYERRSEELERRCGAKVGALVFMHIPLPEYAEAFDGDPARVGFRLESECPGRDNHGMFEAMVRRGDVRGVFAGHDHSNDYAAVLRGIVLAYGRYSGGYAEYQELVSGARVIELHRDRPGFVTWVRLANGREVRRAEYPRP